MNALNNFEKYTERLFLRPLRWGDLDEYYEIMKKDEVCVWLGGGRGKTYEEVELLIATDLKQWQEKGYGVWGVIHRKTGKLLGHCGLGFLKETGEVEILYAFDPQYWGYGFATESAIVALNYAFEEAKLEGIIALAKPDNKRSINVINKLGLKPIGVKEYFGLHLECFIMTREIGINTQN